MPARYTLYDIIIQCSVYMPWSGGFFFSFGKLSPCSFFLLLSIWNENWWKTLRHNLKKFVALVIIILKGKGVTCYLYGGVLSRCPRGMKSFRLFLFFFFFLNYHRCVLADHKFFLAIKWCVFFNDKFLILLFWS